MKLEKEGVSLSYPAYAYTLDEHKSVIDEVIDTVETNIDDIQSLTLESKKYLVNETRLNYALICWDHVNLKTPEEELYKKETYAKIICLLNSLEDKSGITETNDQQESLSGNDKSLLDHGGRNVACSWD